MDSHRLKTEIVWEEIVRRLVAYKTQHGNCNVPQRYSDQQLGAWVNTQRKAKKRGKLLPERERRLTEVAFVWRSSSFRRGR